MSSNPNIAIGFNAKQFNDEIKLMTTGLKETQKGFQLTNSEMKKTGDALSIDVVKIQQYNKQLEMQKDITGKLKTGLKEATKARDDEKNKLEQVAKALEKAKTAEGANEKEIAKLEKTLKSATSQYNKAETTVSNYNIKLADSQIAENKLQKSIVDTNEAMKKREFENLSKDISKVNDGLDKLAKGFAIATAATAAGVTALFKMSTNAAKAGDEVDKMSQKIGISRKAYQELAYSFSQSGTDINLLQMGMKTLVGVMDQASEGTKSAKEIFKQLKIEYSNTDGLRKGEDVFYDTINALQGISNETERARMATELFGRSGTELMPLLNSGADAFKRMNEEANKYGLVLSDEIIDANVKFTDDMDRLKRTFASIATETGTNLMPVFEKYIAYLQENSQAIGETIGNVVEGFVKFVKTIYDARGAIGALVGVFLALKTALTITTAVMALRKAMEATTLATKGAQAAQVLFNATCMANPYVAVAVVLGTLAAGFLGYKLVTGDATKATRDFNTELKESIDIINKSESAKKSEIELNKSLAKELDILAQKENKTNIEKQRMKSLAEELNKAYIDLNLPIENIASQYMNYKSAIDGVITSAEKLIQIEASRGRAVSAQETKYGIEEKYGTDNITTQTGLELRTISAKLADYEKKIAIYEEQSTGRSAFTINEPSKNKRKGSAFLPNERETGELLKSEQAEYDKLTKRKAEIENDLKVYNDAQKLIGKYSDMVTAPTSPTTQSPAFKYEGQSEYTVVNGVLVNRKTGKPVKQNTSKEVVAKNNNKTGNVADATEITETETTQEVKDLYNERLAISQKYIDDKKFYDNWGADSEIKALERVKEWTKDYYNKGTIDYARYTKEIADIDKDLYTARKLAIEKYVNEEYNSQRKVLDDRRTALDDYYSDIENKEKAQDRATDRAELVELEKQYQFAVTAEGKNKLKDIQDNIKNLDKQQQEEYRQLEKAEKVKELSKEYDKLEASQLEVMKNISSYAQETATTLENITLRIAGLVSSVMGTNTAGTNSVVQNNYNTISDPTSAQIYGNVGFNNMRFLF